MNIYHSHHFNQRALLSVAGIALLICGLWIVFTSQDNLHFDESRNQSPISTSTKENSFGKGGYSRLPIYFEPNQGQAGNGFDFLSRGQGYNLFLDPTAAVISFNNAAVKRQDNNSTSPSSIRIKLAGADVNAAGVGEEILAGRSRYYIGSDPSHWHTDVQHYRQVVFRQIYPGIDVVYHGGQDVMEFDFRVAPGTDPRQIHLTFDDLTNLHLDQGGNLVLHHDRIKMHLNRPIAYQEKDGHREFITASFDLTDNGAVGFRLAAYDHSRPLIIDPVITYSGYLGGSSSDAGLGIALDGAGNRYLTGSTTSLDFPSAGNNKSPNIDAFIAKLDATGTSLVYVIYVGGFEDDIANAITVDPAGNAYITGNTTSGSLPLLSGIQTNYGGDQDGFIAKVDDLGNLVYTTFIGGSEVETALDIAIDPAAPFDIYVGGSTLSADFPKSNCVAQCFHASPRTSTSDPLGDGYVVKISNDGTSMLYFTYLGGSDIDKVAAIVVDDSGKAYLTGDTSSNDFPVTFNAFQNLYGGPAADAFVTILAANGTPGYSSFLGGASWDRGLDIAVDDIGNAYVTGFTSSALILTPAGVQQGFPFSDGAFQVGNAGGDFDAFFTKINPLAAASGLVYSTYFGGENRDEAASIALNAQRQAIIFGTTGVNQGIFGPEARTNDFPLLNAIQLQGIGDSDTFIARFDSDGTLLYSTYLGGDDDEVAHSVVVDDAGIAYVTGTTTSTDFPTVNALQATSAGNEDIFVTDIDPVTDPANLPDLAVTVTIDPFPVPKDESLVYTLGIVNNGPADASGISIINSLTNSTVLTMAPQQGNCNALDPSTVSCNIGSLTSGASTSVTVTTKPVSLGNATSVVNLLRANQTDTNVDNNTDEVQILVVDNSGESIGSLSYWLLLLIVIGIVKRRLA